MGEPPIEGPIMASVARTLLVYEDQDATSARIVGMPANENDFRLSHRDSLRHLAMWVDDVVDGDLIIGEPPPEEDADVVTLCNPSPYQVTDWSDIFPTGGRA